MALSSMLSRGVSRRQLSSLQSQCEALSRGIEEAHAERQRSWASAERQRSEATELELCLQRLPRPTSTISGSVPPIDGVAATRRRLEALTTEAAMEGAALEEAQVEMKELRRELQSLSQQLSSCDLHSLESERQTLMEEELVQEEFLMQSKQMLEERDRELAECSAYWEAVPFLSTETCSLEEWQEDLEVQRSELWQLQSELTAAEEVAALKASAHEKEQQTPGLWSKLAELQSPSRAPSSPRDVAQLLATSARLKAELARLQAQALDFDAHRALHPNDRTGLSRVLAATGARTVEHMKDLLKQNLVVMQELQELELQ